MRKSFLIKKPIASLLGIASCILSSLVIAQTNPAPSADLFLEGVTVSPNPVNAGADVHLTIKIKNFGPDAADNVVLTNTIPDGLVFKSIEADHGGTCAALNGDEKIQQCTWAQLLPSAIGGTEYINSVVLVLGTSVENSYNNHVVVASDTADPNQSNNSKTSTISVREAANLNIAANAYDASGVLIQESSDFQAGVPYYYEVNVDNLIGPNAVPAGSVVNVLFKSPFGATITSIPTGEGWTCTPSEGYPLSTSVGQEAASIRCSMQGPLLAGSVAEPIQVPMVGNAPINGAISATFELDSTYGDGGLGNNSSSVVVNLSPGVDLSIDKSVTYASDVNGNDIIATFVLQARHNGGGEATQIIVRDALDEGIAYDASSLQADGWDCQFDNTRVLTCTYASFSDPFSDLPPIRFTARIINPSESMTNTASVEADQFDPDLSNNDSSIVVFNSVRLGISKRAEPSAYVMEGEDYSWIITVDNYGPVGLWKNQSIRVEEAIPQGMNIKAVDNSSLANGWACYGSDNYQDVVNYPVQGPSKIYCELVLPNGLPYGAAGVLAPQLKLLANNDIGSGTLQNQACVLLAGLGPIQTYEQGQTQACTTFDVTGVPSSESVDVAVTKTVASPVPYDGDLPECSSAICSYAGEDLVYTLTVKNLNGEGSHSSNLTPAKQIRLTDNFYGIKYEEDTEFPHIEIVNDNAGDGVCYMASRTYMVCQINELQPAAEFTVQVTIKPTIKNFDGQAFVTHTNSADILVSGSVDRDSSNNKSAASSIIIPAADLAISKSTAKDEYQAGSNVEYTLAIENQSPSEAYEVVVEDIVPAGMDFGRITFVSPGGDCNWVDARLRCNWDTIDANAHYLVRYIAVPDKDSVGQYLKNTATVSAATIDRNLTNNSAEATIVSIEPEVDVFIKKSAEYLDGNDKTGYDLGEFAQYAIVIENLKTSRAYDLEMVDTFGSASDTAIFSYQGGLQVISDGIDVGTGMCQQPDIGDSGGRLTCNFDVIGIADGESDGSGKITISYQMKSEGLVAGGQSNYSGSFYNLAEVIVEGDMDLNDNQSSVTVTTRQLPANTDYQITKRSSKNSVSPGEQFVYTLSVLNNGPDDGEKASVYDDVPLDLEVVDKSDTCYFASGSANHLTCSTPALKFQESVDFDIVVRVKSPYTGPASLTNEASVDLNGDTNPDNNHSSVVVTVASSAAAPVPVPLLNHRGLAMLAVLLMLIGAMTVVRRKQG